MPHLDRKERWPVIDSSVSWAPRLALDDALGVEFEKLTRIIATKDVLGGFSRLGRRKSS